jgi:hypothetical protein
MFRFTTCAAAAFVLAATALAGEVTDPSNTFRMTTPDGWTSDTPPTPAVAVVVISPRRNETGGNCNVVSAADESTKKLSQAEVEAMFDGKINGDFWKASLGMARGIKSTTIEKWGDKTQRGRKVFYMRSTSDFVVGDRALTVTQLADFHVVPGRIYIVTCTAAAQSIAREETDFAAIMESFEPVPDILVSSLRPRRPMPFAANVRPAAFAAQEALNVGAWRATRR